MKVDRQIAPLATLSEPELAQVQGARSIIVNVDGTHLGTIDDWQLEIAIFEGRIGVKYV